MEKWKKVSLNNLSQNKLIPIEICTKNIMNRTIGENHVKVIS